jgi:hypothetical protein
MVRFSQGFELIGSDVPGVRATLKAELAIEGAHSTGADAVLLGVGSASLRGIIQAAFCGGGHSLAAWSSVIAASVVMIMPATEAASCKAVRTTLAGSITPAAMRSS